MSGKYIDLVGKKFGRWTVIKRFGIQDKVITWWCKCDCGTEGEVAGYSLRHGRSKSCGCYQKEEVSKRFFIDLLGKRFGKWVVIRRGANRKQHT
jgi:hypothetical protein